MFNKKSEVIGVSGLLTSFPASRKLLVHSSPKKSQLIL